MMSLAELEMYNLLAEDARKRLVSFLDALNLSEQHDQMIWESIQMIVKYETLVQKELLRKQIMQLFEEPEDLPQS
jgi:hypothetical protein